MTDWIEPFLWQSAQIASVDAPSMMIYEGIFLGLQFVWNGLRFEVDSLAREYALDQKKAAQQ
jgi:hypothetical protein